MIVILRPGVSPEEIEAVEEAVRSRDLEPRRVGGGTSETIVVVGETRATSLEHDLTALPAVDRVVQMLPERSYEHLFSRRSFLDVVLGAIGGLASLFGLGAAAAYFLKSGRELGQASVVPVGSLGDFRERNSRLVSLQGRPVIIVRAAGDDFYALSAVCTHSEVCQIQWDSRREQLVCPCHRAAFDVYGNVLHGPPPRPLRSYPVEIIRNRLYLRTGV